MLCVRYKYSLYSEFFKKYISICPSYYTEVYIGPIWTEIKLTPQHFIRTSLVEICPLYLEMKHVDE